MKLQLGLLLGLGSSALANFWAFNENIHTEGVGDFAGFRFFDSENPSCDDVARATHWTQNYDVSGGKTGVRYDGRYDGPNVFEVNTGKVHFTIYPKDGNIVDVEDHPLGTCEALADQQITYDCPDASTYKGKALFRCNTWVNAKSYLNRW
ncbi:hypothetical protein PG990_001745 [Apiospora arundinis]